MKWVLIEMVRRDGRDLKSSEMSSSLVAGTGRRRCGGFPVGRDRNLQQVLPQRK